MRPSGGDVLPYFGWRHPFSHLHPAPLATVMGNWATVEQGFQIARAEIEGQPEVAREIYRLPRGLDQKKASKKIRPGPRHRLWACVAIPIMFALDREKFLQNPVLGTMLVGTGMKELIENCPYDTFWGPPLNVAGEILMSVRGQLQGVEPTPRTLWVGDSLLRHARESLGAGHQVVCIPGAQIKDITTIAPWLLHSGIERVILCIGTNDLFPRDLKGRARRPKNIVRDYRLLVNRLRGRCPRLTFWVTGLVNRWCDRNPGRRAGGGVEGLNRAIRTAAEKGVIAAGYVGTPVLGLGCFRPDGLHLTPEGSATVIRQWVKVIGEI